MVIKISKEKYDYVYFVVNKELYKVHEWVHQGNYPDVSDLVLYNVKSWKPFWVKFLNGDYHIVNGEDKYGDCERAYLGVKIQGTLAAEV